MSEMDDENFAPIAVPVSPVSTVVLEKTFTQISAPSHPPTKPGWQVYTCGAFWALVIILIFISGFLLYIPWLGGFAFLALVPGFFLFCLSNFSRALYTMACLLEEAQKRGNSNQSRLIPIALIEYGINFGFTKLDEHIQVQIPWKYDAILDSFISAFIVAALCEEVFKLLMAMAIPLRYIVQFGILTKSPVIAATIAGTRAFLAVPLHAATGILYMHFDNLKRDVYSVIAFLNVLMTRKYLETAGDLYILGLGGVCILVVLIAIIYARRKAKEVMSDAAGYMPLTSIQSP